MQNELFAVAVAPMAIELLLPNATALELFPMDIPYRRVVAFFPIAIDPPDVHIADCPIAIALGAVPVFALFPIEIE